MAKEMKKKGGMGQQSPVYSDKSAGLVDQVKSVDRESTVMPMSSTGEKKPKRGPEFA